MKNRTTFRLRSLPLVALLCVTLLPKLSAQDAPSETPAAESGEAELDAIFESLGKAAESFVDAFNNRDAAAIAALYTPLGTIVGSDGETVEGREAIEDYYRDLFAGEAVPMIALEATFVELIAPDEAIEEGFVHLTMADDEPVSSIGYIVTHSKQADGSWLMAASHSFSEVSTPSEQLKPLHWLIGEWTLESDDGVRIDMVIDLDDFESDLLGEALMTDAMGKAQIVKFKLGWNPATTSVFWWTSDSEGGNSSGPWARRGDEWILQTTGFTADAEASASSQTLARDGDTMVWSASHRILAGEALPDLIYRFVRRAPDPLSLLAPESDEEPDDTEHPLTEGDGEPGATVPPSTSDEE